MQKLSTIIAGSLLLVACSPAKNDWVGVIESAVPPPYDSFTTESGKFKSVSDCEHAMKLAAGDQQAMPPVKEGFVLRTIFYRCRQEKDGKAETLVATKYVVLPANR